MTNHSDGKQLEALMDEMRQMLHVFSHDIRNPLVNMKALLSEMRDSLQTGGAGKNDSELQKERLDTLQMLEQSVAQMDRLIRNVSEIYHCKFDDLECEEVALQELVERVVKRFDNRADVNFSIDSLPSVWADPLAMGRVIEQLFSHVMQTMGINGGVVTVTVGIDGMNDLLMVKSTGKGMSDEEIYRIFEPFWTQSSGTGLAAAKALVEAHGGRIWCESGPEEGETFYISLPRRQ